MVSGGNSMSCGNSGSTMDSCTSCSSQAEGSTDDSGKRGSNSKQSSCSSKVSSRESSSTQLGNRSRCLLENAVFPRGSVRSLAGRDTDHQLSKLQEQNQQQEGMHQQQQVKHQKRQQKQDQQQRRQQHRKHQRQVEKDEADLSTLSAWPTLSADRSMGCAERKELERKGGGAGGGGGATAPASEILRTCRKACLNTTAARRVEAAGSKDCARTEVAEMVSGCGSAATAATPGGTGAVRISEAAEAGTPAIDGTAADRGAAATVAEKRDGTDLVVTAVPASGTASGSTAQPSAAAAAPRLPTGNGARTAGKTPPPAVAPSSTALATVFPGGGGGVVGRVGVCALSSATVEPKKGRAPRRAPWCKPAVLSGTQKQHSGKHEQREPYQLQRSSQQQQHCTQQQQHQQKEQVNEGSRTKTPYVDLLLSTRGDILTEEKEAETDEAVGDASAQTSGPENEPLAPPSDAFPAGGAGSDMQTARATPAPSKAAEMGRALTATEGLRRQQQEARLGKQPVPSRDDMPQERGAKVMLTAASPKETHRAAALQVADTFDRVRAHWMQQEHHGAAREESEGRLSTVVAEPPPELSTEKGTAAAELCTNVRAAEVELPLATEDAQTLRIAAITLTPPEAAEKSAPAAAGDKAAWEQPRQKLRQEEQKQPQDSASCYPAGTFTFAKSEEAVPRLITSVKVEHASSPVGAAAGAAPRAASACGWPALPAADHAAASLLPAAPAVTVDVSVSPTGPSFATPRTPADGRRTFAAAAAAALQGCAGNQKGRVLVPRQHQLPTTQQRQQMQQVQRCGGVRSPGLPVASTEEGKSERLHPKKLAVVARADNLSSPYVASDGSPSSPAADAPMWAAAVPAVGGASDFPRSPASAVVAAALAAAGHAADAATTGTAATPCNKKSAGHATESATQQQRPSPAATTRGEEGEQAQRRLVPQLELDNSIVEKLQQRKHQDKKYGEQELSNEEKHSEQHRRRQQPWSYDRQAPRAQQSQHLVTLQQRQGVQDDRQHEASDGEGGEVAAKEEQEREDEKRGQGKRSPSVDRRQITDTDEALSIPLTSTILADRRSVFYKTQLCPHAVRGRCRLDEQCNFAHSRRELRPPPRLDKTKICASIKAGVVCPNGQRCLFAHNREELRHSVAFYKTNMCRSWISGACMHPHTCNHAHGMRELFFFRTLAAVAGCRDFRRERHGVAAAVAAASTPSKAASVAAALDSLRRHLAATPSAAAGLHSASAAGDKSVGDGATYAAGGVGGGARSPRAAAAGVPAEHPAFFFAGAGAAYDAGVGAAEREGRGEHAAHNFLKGVERQKRSTYKADAGAKRSGSSSDSTLTLDSSSSNHRYSDGSSSSSSTNECCSGSRGSLHTSSTNGNSRFCGASETFGKPEVLSESNNSSGSGSGVVQQQNNKVLQQQVKHLNSSGGDRQRTSQGSNATHQQQPKNRFVEQHQPTNSNSEQEGNLDDLVTLIPLLPDKERQFAELLLAYIEASSADKENTASLILPIPPEITVEAVGGSAGEVATAAAELSSQGEAAGGGEDLAAIAATEACEHNGATPANGKWATEAKQSATEGSTTRVPIFNKTTTAGGADEKGTAGTSEAVAGLGESELAQERSMKGSRGGAAAGGGGGSRATALAAARRGSEAAPGAAACGDNRVPAGDREALPRRQDVQAKHRTPSTRRQVIQSERQGTAVFNVALSESLQQHHQLKRAQATRVPGAAAAAEVDFGGTHTQRTGAKPDSQTQKQLHAEHIADQQLQQQQKQQQPEIRDPATASGNKPDASLKARQVGKRCGRKSGSNTVPGNGFILRREHQLQLLHPWGTLEHQRGSADVQEVRVGENRLQNFRVNAADERSSPRAAGAAEQQQQQQQQLQQEEQRAQNQGHQFLFQSRQGVGAARKKRIYESWAAAAAARSRNEVKENATASAPGDAVVNMGRADTIGGVRHASEVLSSVVHSQFSQGVHEQQRQQLLAQNHHRQQGAPSQERPQEAPQPRQPWKQKQQQRMRQQLQKCVPAELKWLCSTRRDATRNNGSAGAASGKAAAEEGESLFSTVEASEGRRGRAPPGLRDQELCLETLAVCRSSGVPSYAPPSSSCAAAPGAGGGLHQKKLVQQAQQAATLQQMWGQQQQLLRHRGLSPPLRLPSPAAAVLLNREVAAVAGTNDPEQQLQLHAAQRHEQHERGPGRQQQRWERLSENHSQQQGSLQRQQDNAQRIRAAAENSSQPGLSHQARCAPRRQQQQPLPRPIGASAFALDEAEQGGRKHETGAGQLVRTSQLTDLQGPRPPSREPDVKAALQLQERQDHHSVRPQWQHESEQQQFQQERQGKADERQLQQQQSTKTGDQQQYWSTTSPFNVSAYPLLWRLYSETGGVLSPAETSRQRQQQQRERDIRAAVRACWDDDEQGKTIEQPSSLRIPTAGTAPHSSVASPVLPSTAAVGTVLDNAGAEAGQGMFSFCSPSDPASAAAATPISCAAEVAGARPAAAATSLRADALAAVRRAAEVLAAAAAGAVGTRAAGGAAPLEAVQAASEATVLLEGSRGESALNATAHGSSVAEGSTGSSKVAERRLLHKLEEEQRGSETNAAAAESLASFVMPLQGEQKAVSETTGLPQGSQLLTSPLLQREDETSTGEGDHAAARHLEYGWIYGGNSEKETCWQSATSRRHNSNLSAVDNENSVTLLQQLLLQRQAALGSSTNNRPLLNGDSPDTSSGTLLTSLPVAVAPSAPVVVPATAHHAVPANPAAAAALPVASSGAEDSCSEWVEFGTGKKKSVRQSANAGGARGIQQHLLLQLGCSDARGVTNSTAARRARRGSVGGAESWTSGTGDEDAEFAKVTADEVAPRAKNSPAVDGEVGASSTPGTTVVREGATQDQACSEPSIMWRRRAKSFAVGVSSAAVRAGGMGQASAVGGRRRSTTADVRGGENASSAGAEGGPLQTAASAPPRTAAGEGGVNFRDCAAADAAHTATADGVSTAAAAASAGAEPGPRYVAAKPLQERIRTARAEDSVGASAEPLHSILPRSPPFLCSSLTCASSSSFPSSSSSTGEPCVDRETAARRSPVANHDEELVALGGGATAITEASPAWSYSASTAAASDDYMDCRVMLLPSSVLLDRLPAEERDGTARGKTSEWAKQQQAGGVTDRGMDIQERVQQELRSQPQQLHTHQGRQRQQPEQQPQQQQANEFFLSELLTTEPLAAGSAARRCVFDIEEKLGESGNSRAQQEQQQQRQDATGAPFLIDPPSTLHNSSMCKAGSSSCLYNESRYTSEEMARRFLNPGSRSSNDAAGPKDDVQQLHERRSRVEYSIPCDSEVSSSINCRWNSSRNSGQSARLYSSSSSSHTVTLSSSSCCGRKCGGNSSSLDMGDPETELCLHPLVLQEKADNDLQVDGLRIGETRGQLHNCLSSDQVSEARETEGRKRTAVLDSLTENDVPFPDFRPAPHPLFDARRMQQLYWQQQTEVGQPQEVTSQQQKPLDGRSLELQHKHQMDLGPEQPFATLAAEPLRLERQRSEVRDEGGHSFYVNAAEECKKTITRPRPNTGVSMQEGGGEENNLQLPQHAGGRMMLPLAKSSSVRLLQAASGQEGLCEEDRHQQQGVISQIAAAGERPVALSAGEPASNLDSSSTTLQSSVAMMNAVVLIERMMNALGLES